MTDTLLNIDQLLEELVKQNGSDLHVTVGSHPAARVRG